MPTQMRAQLMVAATMLASVSSLVAQPCSPPETRARVRVGDSGINQQSLWFGFHVDATEGIDTELCEIELPPIPPAGVFHASFRLQGGGVQQFTYEDYRPYVGPARVDTHLIRFQPGDIGFPMILRWDPDSVVRICDSAVVMDQFGGLVIRANMGNDSQAVIANQAINQVLIIRYGQRLSVNDARINVGPTEFALLQNYPNPFNPATRISFQQATNNWVTLRVFDLLGRQVATLVDGMKDAGIHTAEWDAGEQSGGVYFYRLTAGAVTLTRKMLLVR